MYTSDIEEPSVLLSKFTDVKYEVDYPAVVGDVLSQKWLTCRRIAVPTSGACVGCRDRILSQTLSWFRKTYYVL